MMLSLRTSLASIAIALAAPLLGSAQQVENRFIGRLTLRDTKLASLAMSPDNKSVIWTFTSGWMTLIEPKPNKFIAIEAFPAHTKPVACVSYSPDSKWIATGGAEGTVKLWETAAISKFQNDSADRKDGAPKPAKPQAKRTIAAAHTGGVNYLAYSPDGKHLATCGHDGTVKVWNVEVASKQPSVTITAHKGGAFGVAYSPDGALIASAGADGTAKLWKAAGGGTKPAPVFTLAGHDGPVLAVAFSPDGKHVATGSGASAKKSGEVVFWDVETGKEEFKITNPIEDVVTTLAFHPNLPRLAVGGKDKKIRVFSTETKKQLYVDEHAEPLIKIAFSGDGTRLGSACSAEAKYWFGTPKIAP